MEKTIAFFNSFFSGANTEDDIGFRRYLSNHSRFSDTIFEFQENNEFFEYLSSLPLQHREDRSLYVHANPIPELNPCGYFDPQELENTILRTGIHPIDFLNSTFSHIDKICFLGHTHVPAVVKFDERESKVTFVGIREPKKIDCKDLTPKFVANAGSVGQPRDGDWRACYVVYDGERIEFRRVKYDYEKASRKILLAGIERRHALRLRPKDIKI